MVCCITFGFYLISTSRILKKKCKHQRRIGAKINDSTSDTIVPHAPCHFYDLIHSVHFSSHSVRWIFLFFVLISVWSHSKYYHVSFCVIRGSRLFLGGLIYLDLKMFLLGRACFLFELNTVQLSDMHE